jgi:hypothetical protein
VNDRQRIRLAQAVSTRANLLAKALDHVHDGSTVIGRIRDAQGGLRARAFDSGGRTMRHDATFAGSLSGDQAVTDERDLDKAIRSAVVEVNRAWAILGRYPAPHRATAADRLALGRVGGVQEPGCESCARTLSPAGGPRWEPLRQNMVTPTTVGDRITDPKLLCSWCYSCVYRWGRLPSVAELERHHRGEIVPWPFDVRKPT